MMYFVVRPEGAESAAAKLPPARDRMPTMPYDLSEFARLHTGPSSWSAEPEHDDPRRSDVVRVVDELEQDEEAEVVDDREAFVLSLVTPKATVADVLDLAGLPISEVLAILANLSERGMVTLERSSR